MTTPTQNTLESALKSAVDEINREVLKRIYSERLEVYNPATHLLIAREDVPEGLREDIKRSRDHGFVTNKILTAAALIAQKTEE